MTKSPYQNMFFTISMYPNLIFSKRIMQKFNGNYSIGSKVSFEYKDYYGNINQYNNVVIDDIFDIFNQNTFTNTQLKICITNTNIPVLQNVDYETKKYGYCVIYTDQKTSYQHLSFCFLNICPLYDFVTCVDPNARLYSSYFPSTGKPIFQFIF
jgi:hypothetical protein